MWWREAAKYNSLIVSVPVLKITEHDVVFDHKKPVALSEAVHTEENWEHWFHCEGAWSVCDLADVCVRVRTV